MPRRTISFDEEAMEWIKQQASDRGASQSQIVREAVAQARRRDRKGPTIQELAERVARLEEGPSTQELAARVARLEEQAENSPAEGETDMDSERPTSGRESATSEGHSSEDSQSHTEQPVLSELGAESEDSLADQYRRYLTRHTESSDARKAIAATFVTLRTAGGELTTGELRQRVYDSLDQTEYADAEAMWQSIQRLFDDLPGIKKAGYGKWTYAGDEPVRDAIK